MRDSDVRSAVKQMLGEIYAGDATTRIVEEMGLWSGSVRIDIAVINGELIGYELKSDRDTLDRLPAQSKIYSRVFDKVELVVGVRHADKAKKRVPRWWGITIAVERNGEIALSSEQQAQRNPAPDAELVAKLLWKDEAITVLDAFGLSKGWRSKPVGLIHRRLADELSFDDLSDQVRTVLKRRIGWLGQPVCDERHVAVGADFDPRLAAA